MADAEKPAVKPEAVKAVKAVKAEADDKRVLVTGVRKQKLEIPADATIYKFKSRNSGEPRRARARARSPAAGCWRMGQQGPDEFARAAGLADNDTRFTPSTTVKIYFPSFTRYFVVKSFRDAHGFTLLKLLRHIHTTASMAVAHFLHNELQRTSVRRSDVDALLKRYAVCSLRIKPGKIFVVTTDA
jgi:hypothetical protein